MKKIFFYGIAAFLTFSFILIEASSWTSDAAHSRLGFSITHMGINDVNGEFKNFEVKIQKVLTEKGTSPQSLYLIG